LLLLPWLLEPLLLLRDLLDDEEVVLEEEEVEEEETAAGGAVPKSTAVSMSSMLASPTSTDSGLMPPRCSFSARTLSTLAAPRLPSLSKRSTHTAHREQLHHDGTIMTTTTTRRTEVERRVLGDLELDNLIPRRLARLLLLVGADGVRLGEEGALAAELYASFAD